jgi:hypothetical protein
VLGNVTFVGIGALLFPNHELNRLVHNPLVPDTTKTPAGEPPAVMFAESPATLTPAHAAWRRWRLTTSD